MWFYFSAVECWVGMLFYFTLHASGITMASKMRMVLECGLIVPLWNVRLARLIVPWHFAAAMIMSTFLSGWMGKYSGLCKLSMCWTLNTYPWLVIIASLVCVMCELSEVGKGIKNVRTIFQRQKVIYQIALAGGWDDRMIGNISSQWRPESRTSKQLRLLFNFQHFN